MTKQVRSQNYNGDERRNGMRSSLEGSFKFYVYVSLVLIAFSGFLFNTRWMADMACKISEAAMTKADLNEKTLIGLSKDVQYQTELLVKIYRRVEGSNAD